MRSTDHPPYIVSLSWVVDLEISDKDKSCLVSHPGLSVLVLVKKEEEEEEGREIRKTQRRQRELRRVKFKDKVNETSSVNERFEEPKLREVSTGTKKRLTTRSVLVLVKDKRG